MDQFDEITLNAIQVIGEHGVQITYVGPGEETVPFAYTAGLTAKGHPELMLLGGVAPETAHGVLNDLARRVLKDGLRLSPGDRLGDVITGYDVIICGPARDTGPGEDYPVSIARAVYGNDKVTALQVVYPDPAGWFPWEPGYAMPSQPLIGGTPPEEAR